MANTKIVYGSSVALTITLANLASDTNLLAGRCSLAWDNTSNLYLDLLLGGFVSTGTSPTTDRSIEIWAYGSMNDTPVYQDTLDGTDSNKTLTAGIIKQDALQLVRALRTDNTTNRKYYCPVTSIASLFGGVLPKKGGIFVVHNTGVNLRNTSDHEFSVTPAYLQTT